MDEARHVNGLGARVNACAADGIATRGPTKASASGSTQARHKANDAARDFDPPEDFPQGGSVFDYLYACRPHRGTQPLELRIIRSTFRTARVPRELEEDVAQTIRLAWAMKQVRPDRFEPEQVLQYAYRIAGQAALHERREIENVARIPGNGYRKRPDGTRYAPSSVTARAFSWEDMARYHRPDAGHEDDPEQSQEQDEDEGVDTDQDALIVNHGESALERARARLLDEYGCRLTVMQAEILQDLASGMDLKEIHASKGMSYIRILREIWISSSVLGVDISKIELRQK